MRLVFTLALLTGITSLTTGQPPKDAPPDPGTQKDPEPRYGVAPKVKVYPQDTAKRALLSTVEAIEKGEIGYLVAHLMDPGFVEFRLADRAKQFEAPVEVELSRLRDFQLRNKDKFKPEDRLPTDRAQFVALIVARSREEAFKQLVRDVETKLLNDPQALKDLKTILKDGMFIDIDGGAKAIHEKVKDRALFFRKIENRWFLENRQDDLPQPKKEPGM